MNRVRAIFSVADLRRAAGARTLGIYEAPAGWTYDGRPIDWIEFDRFEIVRYGSAAGAIFATFQSRAGIDD